MKKKNTSKKSSRKSPAPGTLKKGKHPILVPVDFSAHSEAALEYATHLAECLQTPLAVLHVVHDPGDAPGYYHVKGREKQLLRLEDVASDMLNEFMVKMLEQHSGNKVLEKAERLLVTGLPVTRILEVANKLGVEMVVMGSAGRTGLSHFLLGSKAEQVLRLCPFPVTIVKLPENQER
jgi:nucleotide-binding universal stress UspA family protein